MELIYGELTGRLRGHIYDVHNELGVGYNEEAYHQALIRRFRKNDIPVVSKERKWLYHRGIPVRRFEHDLLVFDKIILLLKCFQHDFIQPNYVQMISELKLWERRLGLMVNFGLPKVNIKRIPFTEKPKDLWENYDYVKERMNDAERELMLRLRDAIHFVYNCHGLGYGKTVYQKLVKTELTYLGIEFKQHAKVDIRFDNEVIGKVKMNFFLVEDKVILAITALQDRTNYEILKMQTYLNALGLSNGLLANFGKTRLEIRGIKG